MTETLTGWYEITPDDVIEGELVTSSPTPNRVRLVDDNAFDVEVLALPDVGGRIRIRLPFRLSWLPEPVTEANEWHSEPTGGHGAHGQQLYEIVIDSIRKRWCEQVGDETHLLIEVEGP